MLIITYFQVNYSTVIGVHATFDYWQKTPSKGSLFCIDNKSVWFILHSEDCFSQWPNQLKQLKPTEYAECSNHVGHHWFWFSIFFVQSYHNSKRRSDA